MKATCRHTAWTESRKCCPGDFSEERIPTSVISRYQKWIFWRYVRNEDIRNQTKLPRMYLIIKEWRLRWLRHLLCMEDDRIPKQAIRWQMDSCTRRRPGRPRLNWIDTVTRDLKSIGMAWEEEEQAAVDREDWRGRVAQCVFDMRWTQVSQVSGYVAERRNLAQCAVVIVLCHPSK